MWQNWLNGILGLILMLIFFLGFPPSFKNSIAIILGIIIAVINFYKAVKTAKLKNNSEHSELKFK